MSPRGPFETAMVVVDAIVDRFAVALFTVIFAAVMAQIVMRYLFDNPLTWSEELSRYLFIWIALLGWSLASRNRSHIMVRMFVEMMPRGPRLGFEVLNNLLVVGFAILLGVLGTKLAMRSGDVPTITLFFTFGLVYAVIPIAATLVALQHLREIARLVQAHRRETAS